MSFDMSETPRIVKEFAACSPDIEDSAELPLCGDWFPRLGSVRQT
jgi:hypothetical protein